jgi:two-component sensor histidine kinase
MLGINRKPNEGTVNNETAPSHRFGGSVAAPFAGVWLAALMLIALAVLASLMIWQTYRAAFQAGEARATSSAQVVAAHLEWMMEASDQALRRVDTAFGDKPISSTTSAITDIRQAVGDLPEGFQYSVYDETGRLRFSSVPEAVGIDVSDREYFRRLREGEAIVISPQLEERLSGEQVFVVARRISRKGKFHGAASIAIPTKAMDDFWARMDLGPYSTVSVIRTDGWLVARHPQLPQTMDLSRTPVFTDFLPNAPAGVYLSTASPADGLSRIVGFRKIERWPLVATTGVEKSEALEFFWLNLWTGMIVGLPLLLLLMAGIYWISHLLQADAARRLALEQALERNNFLLREIHHRVKNNLQAVSSLVRLQPLPKEAKEDMGRRIAAMVAVHEQLYGTDQFDRVDLASYAARLVSEVAAGFRGDIQIETHLEPIVVVPDQALPLGLIINEAVSNAFKHAFTNVADGKLVVTLLKEGAECRLVIEDNGSGYSSDHKRGMGSKLIDGFVAQIGGSMTIKSDGGTKVMVSFPVE